MEEPNQGNAGVPTPPVVSTVPQRSGWRIAVGILVCIFTLLVTAVLLFLSICFSLLIKPGSSDAPWLYGAYVATLVVPIGGIWLAVRLFRGPKSARAAGMQAAAPAPVITQTVPPQEAEERLAYLRLGILIAILAHAALLVMNVSRYRGTTYYHISLVPMIVAFVLYQIPYGIVLLGIQRRGERWALSLALMYPILALCFTGFSLLTLFAPWRSGTLLGATLLLHYGLSAAIDLVVFILALRAWQAERTRDDAVQLVVAGVASAFYLFVLQVGTPFLFRFVHF
jgi:hypothetical protein